MNTTYSNPEIEILDLMENLKGMTALLESFYFNMIQEPADNILCTREYEEILSSPYMTIIEMLTRSVEVLERITSTCTIKLTATDPASDEV